MTRDTPQQAPGPEAKDPKQPTPSFAPSPVALAPSPSPHPTSDIALPTFLDSLALALTTKRPHADIAKDHNLTINQLAALLDTQDLSSRVESLQRLQALEYRTRITTKLRAAHESSLDKLLEHKDSDDNAESRKAAQTLLRQTTAMLIALQRPTRPARNSESPSLREGLGWVTSDTTHPAPGPEAKNPNATTSSSPLSSSSSSFQISNLKSPSPSSTPSPSHPPTPSLPPPPKPYSSPDLLFPHQIHLLRTQKPPTPHQAFQAIYETLDHPIKCNGDLQELFKAKLINSTLLNHYNADYEDLGPASFDQEVLIPAPISPDLSLKPVLKHFAIKRYAFARENQTPLYLRVHLAKQDLVKGETADRWYLADLAIDSP